MRILLTQSMQSVICLKPENLLIQLFDACTGINISIISIISPLSRECGALLTLPGSFEQSVILTSPKLVYC